MAAGLLTCSLAAIARTLLSGRLAVSDRSVAYAAFVWCAFGAGMLAAAAFYWRALDDDGPLGRRQLAAALGIHLCAAIATPLTSNDIFGNLAHGRMLRAGLNPYQHVVADLPKGDPFASVDWPKTLNPYGPLVLPVSHWAAGFATVARGVVAFKAAMLAAMLGALLVVYRAARESPGPGAARTFALFGFNPLLAWELSAQAHNDALLVLALTAFVWSATERRDLLAGCCLGIALAVKLSALPVLAFFWIALARTSWRRAALAGVATCVAFLLSWVPFWQDAHSLDGVLIFLQQRPAYMQNSLWSCVRLAGYLIAADWPLRVWLWATRLTMIAGAGLFVWRSDTPRRAIEAALRYLALSIAFGLPYVQPWYGTWLLPLSLSDASWEQRRRLALYTALAPALYLTGAMGALAIVCVHGVGLFLALGPGARQPSEQLEASPARALAG